MWLRGVSRMAVAAVMMTAGTVAAFGQPLEHRFEPLEELVRQGKLRQVLVLLFRKHDQTAEKTTIDVGADVAAVIVERPRAD